MGNGYVLVDCTGLDLIKGSIPQELDGIYADVQAAMKTGKQILAVNCVWDDIPVTPVSAFAIQFDGYVIVTSSTLQVVITEEDVVTINNLVG